MIRIADSTLKYLTLFLNIKTTALRGNNKTGDRKMTVSKFIEVDDPFEIRDINSDHSKYQLIRIGEFSDRVELYFQNLKHLKQFAEQLNAKIEEIEK